MSYNLLSYQGEGKQMLNMKDVTFTGNINVKGLNNLPGDMSKHHLSLLETRLDYLSDMMKTETLPSDVLDISISEKKSEQNISFKMGDLPGLTVNLKDFIISGIEHIIKIKSDFIDNKDMKTLLKVMDTYFEPDKDKFSVSIKPTKEMNSKELNNIFYVLRRWKQHNFKPEAGYVIQITNPDDKKIKIAIHDENGTYADKDVLISDLVKNAFPEDSLNQTIEAFKSNISGEAILKRMQQKYES